MMDTKNKNSGSKVSSLRKKILLSMVCLLLFLGLTTAIITRMILLSVLKTEFQAKGVAIARGLATNSLANVLTQNKSRLEKLVENEKSLDVDIAYAFILDSGGHILAHTFNKGFPIKLAEANKLPENKVFNIQVIETQLGSIYDIAVPILLEKSLLGQARIGVLQNSIQRTITTINVIFMSITFLVMVIGILLAYRISTLITRPISRLVEATQAIQEGDFSTQIEVKTKDEIGLLAEAFNEMSSNLKLMIEKVKQLTVIEERDRICLDLHDGCAQDLANIIKRLELCGKLFTIDPQKAYEELNSLKQISKNVLDRTRQMIFDLKSTQDSNFNLLYSLKDYVKDFQRQNDINVKLNTPEAINDILPDKSKSIFYIIKEALTNIRKHAQAKNVQIGLETNNHNLIINIKDDGRGFDVNRESLDASECGKLGLLSMRQRVNSSGGTFVINSVPNQGTGVSVSIPLKEKVA